MGNAIDFYLSPTRNAKAAKCFPGKTLKGLKDREKPVTINTNEVMRALRKGQAAIFNLTRDICGEARIVERAFGLGSSALAEAVVLMGEALHLKTA